MNRVRIFSYRREQSDAIKELGLFWSMWDVYYYYDGGYIGADSFSAGQVLTPQQLSDYPLQPEIYGVYSTVELCVNGFLRRFRGQVGSPGAFIVNTTTPCGVVCDAAIVAVVVTPATPGNADGQVVITASSSHAPIEYSLDGNTFQAESTFTGLLAGSYTAYVRDNAGCRASQPFAVTFVANAYGEKYRIEYDDLRGGNTKIKIFEKGYVGAVDERCGAAPALSIRWNSEGDDKFKGIKGSEATVQFFSETNFEHLNLFTSDDRQYRVDVEKDNVLYWRGYLLPDTYTEPYLAPPYVVTVTATDGLGDLKGKTFLSTAKQIIDERWTHLELIRFCLAKLDLDLPITCGVNVFESTMDTGPDDDPLTQAFSFTRVFYDDGKPSDLYALVEEVLKIYGARLYLSGGMFHIENVAELASPYRRRLYTKAGVFVSSEAYDPISAIGNPNQEAPLFWVSESQQLEILPGRRLVTLLQDYGLKPNLLPDGEFKPSAFETATQLKKWTGTAEYRRVGTENQASSYTGTYYGNIPRQSTKGTPIKRTVNDPDIYGVELEGSYMQVDSFGRVIIFRTRATVRVILEILTVYWNTTLQKLEGELTPVLPGDTTPTIPDGSYSTYQLCENGLVTRFKLDTSTSDIVVKEPTIFPCPLTFGQIGYIESTPVRLYQDATHQLSLKFDYTVIAPTDIRGGAFASSAAIAGLFLIQLRIKCGSFYLGNEGWTTIPSFVFVSLEEVNAAKNLEFTTPPIPEDGDFTVRIYKLVFIGNQLYRHDQRVKLRIKNFFVNLLVNGEDPPDSLLMSANINPNYNVVPEQIQAILGDLPANNVNSDPIYNGGIYVYRSDAVGIPYNGIYQVGTNSVALAGTGSQSSLSFYKNGDDVYFVFDGQTLADKVGPFQIVGFDSLQNNIVTNRVFVAGASNTSEVGRMYNAYELSEDYYLTREWKRRGPTAGSPENGRELLRILLQNQAQNFSRPSQVLRGTLRGPLSFGRTLIDVNNVNRAFIPTGLVLADYDQQWSGEWVEIIPGYAGGYQTGPEPAENQGGATWEDGTARLWEDGELTQWESANP